MSSNESLKNIEKDIKDEQEQVVTGESSMEDGAEKLFFNIVAGIKTDIKDIRNRIKGANTADELNKIEDEIFGLNGKKKELFDSIDNLQSNADTDDQRAESQKLARQAILSFGGLEKGKMGDIGKKILDKREALSGGGENVEAELPIPEISSVPERDTSSTEKFKQWNELGVRLNRTETKLGEAKQWVERLEKVRKELGETNADSDEIVGGAVYEELDKVQAEYERLQREHDSLKKEIEDFQGEHLGDVEEIEMKDSNVWEGISNEEQKSADSKQLAGVRTWDELKGVLNDMKSIRLEGGGEMNVAGIVENMGSVRDLHYNEWKKKLWDVLGTDDDRLECSDDQTAEILSSDIQQVLAEDGGVPNYAGLHEKMTDLLLDQIADDIRREADQNIREKIVDEEAQQREEDMSRKINGVANLNDLKQVIDGFGRIRDVEGNEEDFLGVNGFIDKGLNISRDVLLNRLKEQLGEDGALESYENDKPKLNEKYADDIERSDAMREVTERYGVRRKASELIAALLLEEAAEALKQEKLKEDQEKKATQEKPETPLSAEEQVVKNGIANAQSVEELQRFFENQGENIFSGAMFDGKQWSKNRMTFTIDTACQYADAWHKRAEENAKEEKKPLKWDEGFAQGFVGVPEAFGLRNQLMKLMREDLEYIRPMKELSDEVQNATKSYVESGGHRADIERLANAKREFRNFLIQHEVLNKSEEELKREFLGANFTGDVAKDDGMIREMLAKEGSRDLKESVMREVFRAQAVADAARMKYYESQRWTEKAKGKIQEVFDVYNNLSWKGKVAMGVGFGGVALGAGLAGAMSAAVGIGVARTAFGAGASYAGFKNIFDAKKREQYLKEDEQDQMKLIEDSMSALRDGGMEAAQTVAQSLEGEVQKTDAETFRRRVGENEKRRRNALLLAGGITIAGFCVGKAAVAGAQELTQAASVEQRIAEMNRHVVEKFQYVWQTLRDTVNQLAENGIAPLQAQESAAAYSGSVSSNEVRGSFERAGMSPSNTPESPAKSFERAGMFPKGALGPNDVSGDQVQPSFERAGMPPGSESIPPETVFKTSLDIKPGGGIIQSYAELLRAGGKSSEEASRLASSAWEDFKKDHHDNPFLTKLFDQSLHAGDTVNIVDGRIDSIHVSRDSAFVTIARHIADMKSPGRWGAIKDLALDQLNNAQGKRLDEMIAGISKLSGEELNRQQFLVKFNGNGKTVKEVVAELVKLATKKS